jgi:restriction system protein
MAIPDFQSIMLPLLELAADNKMHSLRGTIESLSEHFGLSDTERATLLPSGRQRSFDNRVGWARTYLKKAGLLDMPRRGQLVITQRGIDVLKAKPQRIDIGFLEQFAEFKTFRSVHHEKGHEQLPIPQTDESTPEEVLEDAYEKIRANLEAELLEQVKSCSPSFFEHLVVELLVKMGYGGTLRDAGQAIGRSGDGGIDGIIKEDRLGLDVVYIQAKRWDAGVGRPELQKFAGALQGHRAKKGVFITTSDFSKEAIQYAPQIESKIALIDGVQLARLMIDHGLGVSLVETYDIRRIDSDYFVED